MYQHFVLTRDLPLLDKIQGSTQLKFCSGSAPMHNGVKAFCSHPAGVLQISAVQQAEIFVQSQTSKSEGHI